VLCCNAPQAGGSLTYLHGGKPFIRGGDFTARQVKGDRPMQLNYSRAFGGKDLKMFGLICEPTVTHVDVTDADKVIVIASDGLWDVISAQAACSAAMNARASAAEPAEHLVDAALAAHDAAGSIDNVTVVAVYL
jgi:protein phosphatase